MRLRDATKIVDGFAVLRRVAPVVVLDQGVAVEQTVRVLAPFQAA